MEFTRRADSPAAPAVRLKESIAQVVIGKDAVVELLLVALLCEGHVLLEDVPGVGKTLVAKALALSLGGQFRRIQFTPDLLPSDVTGSRVFNQKTGDFEFRPGPLFGNVILADEINRATPRTQSALLEAMEERQVTTDGVTLPLERPFLVIATQNPIELEGTFPLPEAQLDRFLFRIGLGYPSAGEEEAILLRMGQDEPLARVQPVIDAAALRGLQTDASRIHMSEDVRHYLVSIVRATRAWPGVELGGSPRASLALYRSARALACLRGRDYVLPDDVKALAPSVLAHRLILSAEARIKGKNAEGLIADLLQQVAVPAETIPVAADRV